MHGYLEQLRIQRWDDHRYYHHSRINQSLHLVSALSFLTAYVVVFFDPGMAARVSTGINALVLVGSFLIQWLVGRIIALWEPLSPGVYPPQAFQVSFGMVLACIVVAWLWCVGSLIASKERSA